MVRKEGIEHFTEIKRNWLIILAEILHQISFKERMLLNNQWGPTAQG